MAKNAEREQALALRREGLSIGDIAKQLSVSKSTVSYWCRDIALSQSAIAAIARRSETKSTASLLRYAETQRRKRILTTTEDKGKGAARVGALSDKEIFLIGLGLYWGEGYKRGSQEFGFTNSDPEMIKFYIAWLEKSFFISKSDLTLRVSINNLHADRVREVEHYWSELTGISLTQFTKTSLIKVSNHKTYANFAKHMGTLRIKVKQGSALRRQVLGAIEETGRCI